MATIEINGTRLEYTDDGTGRSVPHPRIHQRREDRDEPGSVILGVMDKTALTTGPKPGPR